MTSSARNKNDSKIVRPSAFGCNGLAESAARRLNFAHLEDVARIISIAQDPHLPEVAEDLTQEFKTFGGNIRS
jgi:hypothetical protein